MLKLRLDILAYYISALFLYNYMVLLLPNKVKRFIQAILLQQNKSYLLLNPLR